MMRNAAHDFDTANLCQYLTNQVDGFCGPLKAEKFSGGQSNPTYLLNATSGQYVLRRQPLGKLLKSAHAVDREFRVQRALISTDVPVAEVYHLCEDTSVIGSMFYLMAYVPGRIFWDPALAEVKVNQRRDYYDEVTRILAALHNIKIDQIGLGDYGRPGNYYERQIRTWTKQYRASELRLIEPMEHLIMWVEKNCPANCRELTLVHGDFRFDNIVFNSSTARALAILDWELSTLGQPFSDLAFFCMCLRLPNTGQFSGLAGRNRAAMGIPDESAIVERYCQLRGIPAIDNWHFYLAFSFFRLAAILQGVLKRAVDGNASNRQAKQMGEMVEPLALMALEIIAAQSKP